MRSQGSLPVREFCARYLDRPGNAISFVTAVATGANCRAVRAEPCRSLFFGAREATMFSQGEPPRSEARNRINGKTPKRGVARMERAKPVIGQGSSLATTAEELLRPWQPCRCSFT
jgi:hypothetical protein